MLDWLDGIAGPGYVRALLWTLLALVLLVVVLAAVKLIRSMTFGTFVAGGRNRKTRLAVMDATPVDSHRRLVLIRRDDIEHLLLIGGPTDVVVERDIRLVAQRRPALTGDAGHQPAPAQRPQPQQGVVHHARPQPPAPAHPGKPHEPAKLAIAPKLPPVSISSSPLYPTVKALALKQKPQPPSDIDDDFLDELDVSLDDFAIDPPAAPASKASPSLDDEMTKLLGELTRHKK
ncbi:hypothetical protein [Mesorhizobium sp. A556]